MRTASPSFDFEISLLCWVMTNPQFPSRRFMIMKWSCLTGYQNFMESRPPSLSPRSLISVQVQHQRPGAAMTPSAVWVLLTDTWPCLLVWKPVVTTHATWARIMLRSGAANGINHSTTAWLYSSPVILSVFLSLWKTFSFLLYGSQSNKPWPKHVTHSGFRPI